jgi:hypothetical protein
LICLVLAATGYYYAFFACFFLLVAGIVAAVRHRAWRGLWPATDPRYDEVQIWLGAPLVPPLTGPSSSSEGASPPAPQAPSPSGESPETDPYLPGPERVLSSEDPSWEGVVSMADSF